MNNLEKFILHNSNQLITTFLDERKKHNEIGALFINLDKDSDNVYYLNINMINDTEIKNNIINRNKINTNKVLFYCYDTESSELVEINI